MDITDLNAPINLERALSRYLTNVLQRPTDFTQADQTFQGETEHPFLQHGPGGSVLDPRMQQEAASTAWLGERRDKAQTDLAKKASFANLLMNAGSNIGNLSALMTQLQAGQVGGDDMLPGLLGGQVGKGIASFF